MFKFYLHFYGESEIYQGQMCFDTLYEAFKYIHNYLGSADLWSDDTDSYTTSGGDDDDDRYAKYTLSKIERIEYMTPVFDKLLLDLNLVSFLEEISLRYIYVEEIKINK